MSMPAEKIHTRHERTFETNRFVYPVISRRSGGLSIGVNLNPDKICNFDCIYCQVDRRSQALTRFVELPALVRNWSRRSHRPFRDACSNIRTLPTCRRGSGN
jgi:sulfatase maturation enzyme AslB (radical SAM superfamily)